MAAALPLVVIMEKGAEAAEALNVTEIFYNRVTDHIRNQPDAARSHGFDKQRMDELIQALDGWDDLDAQERSRRNKRRSATITRGFVKAANADNLLLEAYGMTLTAES